MACDNFAQLSDVAYCQGEDAIIHIGELETYSGYEAAEQLRILWTDMATGHKTVIAIGGEYLPELVIHSEDFTPTPGHVYEVKVVRAADLGGITLLPVYPFTATYTGYVLSTDVFDGFYVRFVKVFTVTPTVAVATEQWLTIA